MTRIINITPDFQIVYMSEYKLIKKIIKGQPTDSIPDSTEQDFEKIVRELKLTNK
jgi:hypothetical protein